jgi:Tfp pilus assembly protein PilX
MRTSRRNELGTGLVFGLLFFLFLTALAAGIITRTAVHVRSLQRSEDRMRALAIAEAGAEIIANTVASHRSPATSEKPARLERSFDRGRFVAVARRDGERLSVVSRGIVRSATGSDVLFAIRTTGRAVGSRFVRETWEAVPAAKVGK